MPLPLNGTYNLQGHSQPGDAVFTKPKKALMMRLSPEMMDVLEGFPNNPQLEFQSGENPGLWIGDKFFSMPSNAMSGDVRHEIYLRATSAAKPNVPLKPYAVVTAKLAAFRNLEDKAREKIRNATKDAEQQRKERKTMMLDEAPILSKAKSSAVSKKRKAAPSASSMFVQKQKPQEFTRMPSPTSQLPTRVASPRPSQTSPPSPATKEMLYNISHLLALNPPRTINDVLSVMAPSGPSPKHRENIINALKEVAETDPPRRGIDPSNQTWRLKNSSWLEIRPYEYPNLTTSDRTAMARLVRTKLGDMNTPSSDPVWKHSQYRETPTSSSHNSKSTATSTPSSSKDSSATQKQEGNARRGVSSTEAKAKLSKSKDTSKVKAEIQMKDESLRASPLKPPPTSRDSEKGAGSRKSDLGDQSTAPRSNGPGPSKQSQGPDTTNKNAESRPKTSEPPKERKPIPLPAKPPPPIMPIPQDRRNTTNPTRLSNDLDAKMKKMRELSTSGGAVDTEWDRERSNESRREKDRREEERRGGNDRKTDLHSEREARTRRASPEGDREGSSLKRKNPRDVESDGEIPLPSKVNPQKRRKTEEGLSSIPPPSSRDRDRDRDRERGRNDSRRRSDAPVKVKKEASPPPLSSRSVSKPEPVASSRSKFKRETSPLTFSRIKREASPPAPSRVKREPSPPNLSSERSKRPAASTKASGSVLPDDHRSGSAKVKRRSPVYTSSEDEGDYPRKSAKRAREASPGSNSRPNSSSRHKPMSDFPADNSSLRARYSTTYNKYLDCFGRVLSQKNKIEGLLRGSRSNGSISDSEGDEIMEQEGLRRLTAEFNSYHEQLEEIQAAFGASSQ